MGGGTGGVGTARQPGDRYRPGNRRIMRRLGRIRQPIGVLGRKDNRVPRRVDSCRPGKAHLGHSTRTEAHKV